MTEWRNDEHSTLYIQIFAYCKASKNQEPKKQETKKLILWEITESENEKRSWKSQFVPKSTYLNLVLLFHFNSSKIEFSPRMDFTVSLLFCYISFYSTFIFLDIFSFSRRTDLWYWDPKAHSSERTDCLKCSKQWNFGVNML